MKSLVSLLIVAFFAPLCFAQDEVCLKNGDHLSGKLIALDQDLLRLETSYAGVLKIDRGQVQEISTETPYFVQLEAGERLESCLSIRDGAMGVQEEGGWRALPLSAIQSIALEESPEKINEEKGDEKITLWSGAVDTGLSFRSGNTDTTDFNFGASAQRKQKHHTLSLGMQAAYGEADNVLNTRRYQLTSKWQVYPKERFYIFSLGDWERDDGRKLDLRLRGGLGLGYDILTGEKRSLSLDASLNYTHEKWMPFTPAERESQKDALRTEAMNGILGLFTGWAGGAAPTVDELEAFVENILQFRDPLRAFDSREEDFASLSLGAQYKQALFQHSRLEEEMAIHPNLDEMGEFRFISNFALITPLSKVLNLKITMKNEYDSLAKESDVKSWDTTLLTSLQYAF